MTGDGIPDWIRDHYDGDVPSIVEDPSGPIQFDGLSLGTETVTRAIARCRTPITVRWTSNQ